MPLAPVSVTRLAKRSAIRNVELPKDYIHVFLNVGDCGPDQIGMRGSLHTQFACREDYGFMMLFSLQCLKHQYHLIARGQLTLLDQALRMMGKKMKWFTSIATLGHTWRGHLKKLRDAWVQMHHGDACFNNKHILFKIPPLAVAGRWASVDCAQVALIKVCACDFSAPAAVCFLSILHHAVLRCRGILSRCRAQARLRASAPGFRLRSCGLASRVNGWPATWECLRRAFP